MVSVTHHAHLSPISLREVLVGLPLTSSAAKEQISLIAVLFSAALRYFFGSNMPTISSGSIARVEVAGYKSVTCQIIASPFVRFWYILAPSSRMIGAYELA
jgi:hypothetical protein